MGQNVQQIPRVSIQPPSVGWVYLTESRTRRDRSPSACVELGIALRSAKMCSEVLLDLESVRNDLEGSLTASIKRRRE